MCKYLVLQLLKRIDLSFRVNLILSDSNNLSHPEFILGSHTCLRDAETSSA